MSEISVGGKVRLIAIPPYLNTADPRPLLGPPELHNLDYIGTLIDSRTVGYWLVKLDRGSFLLDSKYLEAI